MNDPSDLQAQARFQSFLQEAPNHAPIPPVDSKLQELPFTALSWKTFEQLCCRLVAELPNVEGEPYLYGTPGQDQKGIDIVARVRVNDRLERWCFQCKKIEHLTKNKLADAIKALEYEADRYFFLVASSVGTELQDIIEPHNNKELWDCRILSKKLKDYPNLVADFFGEWWLPVFSNSKTASRNSQQETGRTNSLSSFNLPNPDPYFVGRKDEIDLLTSYLDQARSIVVEGSGGSGKTQLVIRVLDGRDDRPTVWIDVESYLRVEDLQIALSSALQQIGIAASSTNLIPVLHTASICVVFDGVEQATREDWDEMEDFFRLLLTRTRTPQFIFTSQVTLNNLEPNYQLSLKPLEPEDALAILQARGIQGKELNFAEVNALNWLINFADGHTLTLRLIAAHLQRFGNPSTVVERIQQLGSFALDQPRRKKHTRSTSLNIALRLAYDALTSEQKSLLLYLSYLPGGCWYFWLEKVVKNQDLQSDVVEICDWYLVECIHDNLNQPRYKALSPIRVFVQATEKATGTDTAIHTQCEIAKQFMIHAMMLDETYMQFGDVHWGLELFELELPNYLAAINYANAAQERTSVTKGKEWEETTRTVLGLAWGLSTYLFIRGHLIRGIAILQKGIEAGAHLGEECSDLHIMLISMYGRMRDQDGISRVLLELENSAQKSNDPKLKAKYAIACGDFAFSKGRYVEADIYYQEAEQYYTKVLGSAEAIHESIEDPQRIQRLTASLAHALSERARTREYMKDFELGLKLGEQALNLLFSIGDQTNPPSAIYHIGRCYAGLKQYKNALSSFTRAASEFYQIGAKQYLGNAVTEISDLAVRRNVLLSDISLPPEIITAGLNDVADEMRDVLSIEELQIPWGREVIRKSFAIMALASYRAEPEVLASWALELQDDLISPQKYLILPILQRNTATQNLSKAGALLLELSLIAGCAYTSSQLRVLNMVPEQELKKLCMFCHRLITQGAGWETNPFDWLATWIGLYHPQQKITSDQLRRASTRTFNQGQFFTIE